MLGFSMKSTHLCTQGSWIPLCCTLAVIFTGQPHGDRHPPSEDHQGFDTVITIPSFINTILNGRPESSSGNGNLILPACSASSCYPSYEKLWLLLFTAVIVPGCSNSKRIAVKQFLTEKITTPHTSWKEA